MVVAGEMRILLASDGSRCSRVAVDLVGSVAWPPGSRIHIVSAVADPAHDAAGSEIVAAAAEALSDSPAEVTTGLAHGRPAQAIVAEAERINADLIVVGSRGHGTIATMVLGSVAGEVIDHAGRPVLVARRAAATRVLLAHDGSDHALTAERLIAEWPIFASLPIDVLSVAQLPGPWHLPSSSTLHGVQAHDYFAGSRAELEAHRALSDEAAERLRAAGRQATPLMLQGDAAEKLIETAGGRSADLIVVGSHGRTGLARVLLGSVARNVLLHAPVSVLVVAGATTAPPLGAR